MSRLLFAALFVFCAAAPALGQGLRNATPPPMFRPANPFVPAISQWGPRAAWPGAVAPVWPVRPAWGGWGGVYNPYFASPYTWGWGMSEPSMNYVRPLQAPPLQGAGGNDSGSQIVVNPELPAVLTLEFPADAAVTLNGQAVEGSGQSRTLTSPPLRAGETYTFDVKANWTADGKKFEWDRTVTVASGDRSKVAVARGFPVQD